MMPEELMLEDVLKRTTVDRAVFALRPDYRVLLLSVDGIVPGPSDALLQAAETAANTDGKAPGRRPRLTQQPLRTAS